MQTSSVIASRQPSLNQRSTQIAVLAGLAVFAVAAALPFWSRLFPLDDAYITLSNARVLLSGTPDPAYGTSYLTGATSPAHLLLVAVAGLVVPPIWGSLLIGVAGAGVYILALPRLAGDLSGWQRRAFVFVGATWGYALFNYLNGLETSVAMATSAWLLLCCDDRRKLPILAGVAPFIRPELGLFAALLMLRLLWNLRRDLRSAIVAATMAVAVALPWAIWVFAETGHVVPSTMDAKLVFYRESILPPFHKVLLFVISLWDSMLLPLYFGVPGLLRVRAGWAGALFIVVVAAVSLVVMPSALNWNQGRYQAVFIPILMAGLRGVLARPGRMSRISLALLLAGAVLTFAVGAAEYLREIALARKVEAHAKFVATLPSSSTVLIHDAGRVAWEQPRARLVDVVGLKTPEVVAVHERLSTRPCGSPKSFDRIARDYQATHMVIIDRYNFPCIIKRLDAAGWHLTPMYNDYYTVYRLAGPPIRQPAPQAAAPIAARR